MPAVPKNDERSAPAVAIGYWLLGTLVMTWAVQGVLSEQLVARNVMSNGLWQKSVAALGGQVQQLVGGGFVADVGFASILLPVGMLSLASLLLMSFVESRRKSVPLVDSAVEGCRGWAWWLLPGLWEILRLACFLSGWQSGTEVMIASTGYWFAVALAGWSGVLMGGVLTSDVSEKQTIEPVTWAVPKTVWLLGIAFVVTFTAMNWQLYRGLLTPHGDSAMYEEHLWNITHGKGFRSYLDQGLFLGEHLQVIHLALLPLYWLWPSHLLLELCESLALASGAIPVFWMAKRHTGSTKAAVLLSATYLLYTPLQFLDIAIDLKTFRPTAFGVPLLLFALDQLERRRYRVMGLLLALSLTAKEDYAAVIAPLGIWIALFDKHAEDDATTKKRSRWRGIVVTVLAVVYLFAVIKLIIPAFRQGDVHYARYFGELGSTPGDITRNLFTQPALVFGKLFSQRTLMYLLAMLVPIGCVALRSGSRLLVAAPLFGVLCLLELSSNPADAGQMLIPIHHFHAPLVPIVFWAAAAGLAMPFRWPEKFRRSMSSHAAGFACGCALLVGLFSGLSPLSIIFWDADSGMSWRDLYVPGSRAEHAEAVVQRIPTTARVFSTDFIHPRFTHHARSYDYSGYPRPSDRELTDPVPGVEYYIVIDTQHRYSEITSPEQVSEYKQHPEEWELLPDESDGHFIVLRRRTDRK